MQLGTKGRGQGLAQSAREGGSIRGKIQKRVEQPTKKEKLNWLIFHTLKRGVVILTQKDLFAHQNKHLLVTVFKHTSAFMHNALMSFQTLQHLFESESVCI